MVVALLLDLVGVDREAITDDYAQSPRAAAPATARPNGPDSGTSAIDVMLDHLSAEYGSATGYLRWLGLDDRSIDAIKMHLVP